MFVTRICGKCKQELPLDAFNRMGSGRQHWCRSCFREYFKRRGSRHREQSGAARRRRVAVARRFIAGYLAEHPCVDCGENARPWLLAGVIADAADLAVTLARRDDLPAFGVVAVGAIAAGSTALGLRLLSELD